MSGELRGQRKGLTADTATVRFEGEVRGADVITYGFRVFQLHGTDVTLAGFSTAATQH